MSKEELGVLPNDGLNEEVILPVCDIPICDSDICDMDICGVEGRLSPAGAMLERLPVIDMLLILDNDESPLLTKNQSKNQN